ncbi:VanZ family protein [Pontibacillus yanchengensis]|uniref:VanZ family protein n=1 Tax=Pontibacillus yanchengensis TaxID=462910 RepID=A0ACC7VJ82_9BACI|nr:VanZ family protein [Pontibacillus yanchengensis]MYL55011.1 VanZ family protein [Pontibacillus yanchengensis]
MRINFLLPGILITLVWILVKLIQFFRKSREISYKDACVDTLFFASILFIISKTMFPLDIGSMTSISPSPNINLVPFATIQQQLSHSYYLVPLRNIGGNILLFIPLGFIVSLKYQWLSSLGKVILFGVGLSLIIETIQIPLNMRSFDVDDLLLNGVGTIVGYGLQKLFRVEKFYYRTLSN